MTRVHYIVLLVFVLLVARFTIDWSDSLEQTSKPPRLDQLHEPDYFITDFEATIYELDGKPSYRIKASHLNHFPDDNTMALNLPRFEYLYHDKSHWTADSNSGTLYEDKGLVTLTGNVVITSQQHNTQEQLIIHTSEIHIDVNAKRANTDKNVSIKGTSSTIIAKGMEIDFNTGEMALLSEAKGTYEP